MPTFTIEYRDGRHRIALEPAIAYFAELRQFTQMRFAAPCWMAVRSWRSAMVASRL